MSDRKKVMVLKDDAPFWQFRSTQVSDKEIITEPIMGGVRAAPGMKVEVNDKPAGTILSVARYGQTGAYRIELKPKAKTKPKATPKTRPSVSASTAAPPKDE